jgi:hypothetical protein
MRNLLTSVKRAVEIFRSRILKRIDDMEEKLMLEVIAANSKIVAETQEEMKAVEQYMPACTMFVCYA